MLTQAKITQRRSQQRCSRFGHTFDKNRNGSGAEVLLYDERFMDSACEIKLRNVLTPAGDSLAITGPSTQYNNNDFESKKYQTTPNEGLRCFGNPTLETLNILNRLPTLDQQIKQVLKRNGGGNETHKKNKKLYTPFTRQLVVPSKEPESR